MTSIVERLGFNSREWKDNQGWPRRSMYEISCNYETQVVNKVLQFLFKECSFKNHTK